MFGGNLHERDLLLFVLLLQQKRHIAMLAAIATTEGITIATIMPV
jgi:hypothetical protein